MNRYQTEAPRAMFAFAAVAMTVLTLGVAIVVPASLGASNDTATQLGGATEVAIIPARIDVVGIREQTVATRSGNEAQVKCAGEAS